MSDWSVEPHPVPVELEDKYKAEPYTAAIRWATVQDQLDHATKAKLMDLMHYGLGDIDAHT